MTERIDAFVNPEMLVWARKKSGLDLLGASKKIGVKHEQLDQWENGENHPTIIQAMKMAEIYHRPLSAFYLNAPPTDFSVAMKDYRRLQDSESGTPSPGLLWEKRQAEIRRDVMVELSNNEDDNAFKLLSTVSVTNDSDEVAEKVRTLLGISWPVQKKWRDLNEALNGWKEAIERHNVLVFQTSHQGLTFEPEEARGFSISQSRYPVIVVNSKDAHGARIFTLLHELVHLLLDAGGVCDLEEVERAVNQEQRVEVFCNRVAGSILVPASLLISHDVVRAHGRRIDWEDEEISKLSSEFSTSDEVILRRLLVLNLTSKEFYEYKHEEYARRWYELKEKRRAEGRGGAPPYYRLILRKHGKPFTRQVFGAYYDKQLTLLDVADYLGVKVKFLKDMEREAFITSIGT